jgi:hypothetical protein
MDFKNLCMGWINFGLPSALATPYQLNKINLPHTMAIPTPTCKERMTQVTKNTTLTSAYSHPPSGNPRGLNLTILLYSCLGQAMLSS